MSVDLVEFDFAVCALAQSPDLVSRRRERVYLAAGAALLSTCNGE